MDIHNFEPIFGSWYIEDLIGRGSYGEVYRARRAEYENTIYSAIKHISIADSLDASADQQLQALNREIQINYQVRGEQNFVSIEDSTYVIKPDGSGVDAFIRMELLTCLTQRMRETAMSEKEVRELGVQICRALSKLEQLNIIHRDIKPANIFISSRGDYKLGDFGVARNLNGTVGNMTIAGAFNYMSPEIYLGNAVNHTADIYSLGLVLYRLMNGNRPPFAPASTQPLMFDDENSAFMRRIKGEPLPPPRNASPQLSNVILRACAFDPRQRYQSAREFAEALENTNRMQPFAEPAASVATKPSNYRTAKIAAAVAGGIAFLVLICFAIPKIFEPPDDVLDQADNHSGLEETTPDQSAELDGAKGELQESPSVEEPLPTSIPASDFEPPPTPAPTATPIYAVVLNSSQGGKIYPEGRLELRDGDQLNFRVTADNGYILDQLLIDGIAQPLGEDYSVFVNGSDCFIQAYFRKPASTYTLIKADVSWADAKRYAEYDGGHLATITSSEEYNTLVRLAEEQNIHVLLIGGYVDWNGDYYVANWVTGESFSSEWWSRGEPNNYGGGENRIALLKSAAGIWGLCDVPDDAYSYYINRGIVGYAVERNE